jgi:hypothetical protein
MKVYQNRFCILSQNQAKTEIDVSKDGKGMWSRSTFGCLCHEAKTRREFDIVVNIDKLVLLFTNQQLHQIRE